MRAPSIHHFTVDLGAAHGLEQYTAAEQAVEAADPRYFTTRDVSFHPLDDDDDGDE